VPLAMLYLFVYLLESVLNSELVVRQTLLSVAIGLALVPFTYAQEKALDSEIETISVKHQRQAYRGDVPLRLTPQAVSVISGDLLSDAGVVAFQDALDFSSGIVRQNNFGGMWDGFAIRGFAGDENLPSGYLVNGFSAGRGYSGRRNTANVESIEILKGPGSALYGRSEPGGTVNIITKKPQYFQTGHAKLSLGDNDTKRFEGDYTNALTDDVAFRINGAYEDSGSFRETVETKSLTLNPSFLVNLSQGTNLSYELEVLDQEVPFDRGVVVLNGDFDAVPVERFLGQPNDGPMSIEAAGHQLVLQHKLNDGWDILAGLSYRDSSFAGFSTDVELSLGRQLLYIDGETVTRQRRHRDYNATDLSARFELSGNLETGSLVHHLLMGADAYDYELDTVQSRWRTGWNSGDTTYSINLFNPVYDEISPDVALNSDRVEQQEAVGVYIQDQIDVSEQWQVLLGLRVDKFEQTITNNASNSVTTQHKTATSPRLGVVFQANDALTVYANYAEGFRPNSGADFSGNAFEPEESKSYEVGVKWLSENDVFNGTLALYKAEKSNILTSDQVNAGFSAALGEAQSQGVELDVTSTLGENTSLSLAYAYTDVHTLNDMVNPDWGVEILAGSSLINIAKNTANLTLRHYFELADNDTDIGVSYNYVGKRLGETIDPNYILPSYSVVKLFGTMAVSEHASVMFDIDNLFNKKYYASSYSALWTMPGAPTNYRVSVQYKF